MMRLGTVWLGRRLVAQSFLEYRCWRLLSTSDSSSSQEKSKGSSTSAKDPEIDLKDIDEQLKADTNKSKEEGGTKSGFMNFSKARERAAHGRSHVFSWRIAIATLAVGGVGLATLYFIREQKLAEMDRKVQSIKGKARIGGPWELVNVKGALEGSEQLKGNWLLMYFGFTHCPDICPDEIEKMVEVVDLLEANPQEKIPVIPIFISVDPARDTIERVKEYCAEFSPKLQGFTGTKEQIDRVAKTFRVYYSLGPSTTDNPKDYIVDHSVITYLIDPEGNFHDYYGQNRTATEVANAIRLKILKYEAAERKKKAAWF